MKEHTADITQSVTSAEKKVRNLMIFTTAKTGLKKIGVITGTKIEMNGKSSAIIAKG